MERRYKRAFKGTGECAAMSSRLLALSDGKVLAGLGQDSPFFDRRFPVRETEDCRARFQYGLELVRERVGRDLRYNRRLDSEHRRRIGGDFALITATEQIDPERTIRHRPYGPRRVQALLRREIGRADRPEPA